MVSKCASWQVSVSACAQLQYREIETKQDEEEEERDCKLIGVVSLMPSTIRLVLTAIQQYALETFLLRSCAFCEGDGLAVATATRSNLCRISSHLLWLTWRRSSRTR